MISSTTCINRFFFLVVRQPLQGTVLRSPITKKNTVLHRFDQNRRHLQILSSSSAKISISSIQGKQHNYLFTTTSKSTQSLSPSTDTNHIPPLLVRTALVSSTAALCTPAFPAIGFCNLVLRKVLPDKNLRAAMSGAWGSLFSFAIYNLTPALYSMAPLLLPFAVGNGIACGITYTLLDVTTGGPHGTTTTSNNNIPPFLQGKRLLNNPLVAGTGVGAIVGYIGPYYCYGPAFTYLYGIEGVTESIQVWMKTIPFMTFTSVSTGAVAGSILYPLLYYPIHGVQGVSWINFTAPTLLVTLLATYWLYTPSEDFYVPPGTFVERSKIPLLNSVLRYNTHTGQIETYSVSTHSWIGPPQMWEEGRQLAKDVQSRQDNSTASAGSQTKAWWSWSNDNYDWYGQGPTFDDKLLAWMYYNTSLLDESKFPNHLVNLQQGSANGDLGTQEDRMMNIDGIVGFILDRHTASGTNLGGNQNTTQKESNSANNNNDNNKNVDEKSKIKNSRTFGALMEVLERMDNMTTCQNNRRSGKDTRKKKQEHEERLASLATLSIAVELLMILHFAEKDGDKKKDKNGNNGGWDDIVLSITTMKKQERHKLIQRLEQEIRSQIPSIALYTSEEVEQEVQGGKGIEKDSSVISTTSVESQLEQLSWQSSGKHTTDSFESIMEQWEMIVQQQQNRKWKERIISTGALLLSIAGLLLMRPN